jgi:dethiobiotin synthetase
MTHTLFITGTDTGIGKTLVTAALMAALQARGVRCAPVKPVQTGCENGDDDLAWCLSFSEPVFTEAEQAGLTMFRFPLPASPHLAAREAGQRLTVQSLETRIAEVSKHWTALLIEGAGGLLAPVNESETMCDLIKALRVPVVLVTRDSLGTINHTALTINELQRQGLDLAAVVINQVTPPGDESDCLIRADNVQVITRLVSPCPVYCFGYQFEIKRANLVTLGAPLANGVEQWYRLKCPKESR